MKKAISIALLATSVFATSCTRTIGSAFHSAADIKGSEPAEYVLPVCQEKIGMVTISEEQLMSGVFYEFKGAPKLGLTLEGNLPEETKLQSFGNGQVHIKGNLQEGSALYISVPAETHTEGFRNHYTVLDNIHAPYTNEYALIIDGNVEKDARIYLLSGSKVFIGGNLGQSVLIDTIDSNTKSNIQAEIGGNVDDSAELKTTSAKIKGYSKNKYQ